MFFRAVCFGLVAQRAEWEARQDFIADDVEVLAADEIHAREAILPFCARGEDGGVVEVAFGGHHSVGARGGEAAWDVLVPQDVPVCKDDDVRGKVVADVPDDAPIREACVVALLLAAPSVDREDTRARVDAHFRIRKTRLLRLQHTNLRGDGHGEGGVQRCDEGRDEAWLFLQKRAVVSLSRDSLRAAEVEVYGVAVRCGEFRGTEEVRREVGAELHYRGAVEERIAVEGGGAELLRAVLWGGGEDARVEHGGVAEGVGAGVAAGEETPGLGRG